MFRFISNLITSLIVLTILSFGAHETYSYVKIETLKLVSRGLPPLYDFTKQLTQKEFDWERDPKTTADNINMCFG